MQRGGAQQIGKAAKYIRAYRLTLECECEDDEALWFEPLEQPPHFRRNPDMLLVMEIEE